MTEPISPSEDASHQDTRPFLTPAQQQALLARTQDPDPYTRLEALRQLHKAAPDLALPIFDQLSRTDPVQTIRQFCRTEVESFLATRQNPEQLPPEQHPERKHEKRMATLYQLWGAAFILTGVMMIWNADAQGRYNPDSYVVRFLREMPIAHILAGGLCFLTASEVPSQRFESHVLKWFTTVLILLSYPFGPFVGGWMIFHLMHVGREWRKVSR